MTEDDIAAATGLPLHTWRRRHGADFRARVPVVNEGERLRIYDTAQATAYTNGQALPQTPTTNPDPEDLLSDKEAARILGVDARTVRAYAATGYLPAGTERHGRTWWPRHTIETRRDTPDQRHHNPGRQPGTARTTTPATTPASPRSPHSSHAGTGRPPPTSPTATTSANAPHNASSPKPASTPTDLPRHRQCLRRQPRPPPSACGGNVERPARKDGRGARRRAGHGGRSASP